MKLKLFNGLILLLISGLSIITLNSFAQKNDTSVIDEISFGNAKSETAHQFSGEQSKATTAALNQTARILLPPTTANWQGGSLSFVIKVDPEKQNYITTRFWGSDVSKDRLYFVCGDKQIGVRHLGDIDMLDMGGDAPFYNERFLYTTTPLPLSLTKGKNELKLEIRSQGAIWGYGQNWQQYQKDMVDPTRPIYKVYTHTDGAFVPSTTETQGKAPIASIRKTPGIEVFGKLKTRVDEQIKALINSSKPLNQMQMQFLAKAYRVKWSVGYQNKALVNQVLASLDEIYRSYKKNPTLAESDPATPNADWFGLGPSGQVLHLLYEPLKAKLDEKIDDSTGTQIIRRDGFTDMLVVCRNWHQRHRRQYTNQSMINDLYGFYYANKGLQAINPSKATPENVIVHYLYQSLGIEPWLGSDDVNGKPTYSQGNDYWQLTPKGLTKELGFVGNYGEVIDWCVEIYDATKPQPELPGDEKIKNQIDKIALARSYFRYPMLDDEKYNAMRQETVVGWRDTHYPGDITYAQRPSWDGDPLQIVAATLNPKLIGFAQQMFQDNQFFYSVEQRMKENGFRVTNGLLKVPEQYDIVMAQKPSKYKLPMSWDQPDFVFSDEADGVVVIKNGNEILYASLYWRARYAINYLARVHALTPQYERIATIQIKEDFESSGMFYTLPDWTNMGFGNGGLKYPDGLHAANAGEKLPIAKIPASVPFRIGQENPYAGRANYYELKYGHYIVAMNASKEKTYTLTVPTEFRDAKELVAGSTIGSAKSLTIKPETTVVLYK